jgi:hypothetical protein
MARKFFYICAGMFMLALCYEFGASTVGAQVGGGQIVGLSEAPESRMLLAITRDGQLYELGANSLWSPGVNVLSEAGVGGEVVGILSHPACFENGQCGSYVITSTGDVCFRPYDGATWVARGNVLGGPVPVLHQSWSQVKARYRSTPGMTVTPGSDNK